MALSVYIVITDCKLGLQMILYTLWLQMEDEPYIYPSLL